MILKKVDTDYKVYEIDSESEFKEICRSNSLMLLGNSVKIKNKFYIIEVRYKESIIKIGLFNEDHGIEPSVLVMQFKNMMLIASDKSIYIIDMKDYLVSNHILCDSIIYEMFYNLRFDQIYVICELGVKSLSVNGVENWMYDSDIIENFQFHQDFIELIVDDKPIKISLENGCVL